MPTWEGVILRGKQANHCKQYRHSAVICAKTAEPIEVLFGLWARITCYMGGPDPPWEGVILVDRGPCGRTRCRQLSNNIEPYV